MARAPAPLPILPRAHRWALLYIVRAWGQAPLSQAQGRGHLAVSLAGDGAGLYTMYDTLE